MVGEIERELAAGHVDGSGPIVLACVDHLAPLVSEMFQGGNVFPEHLSGDPEASTDAQLHRRAWSLVADALANDTERALADFSDRRRRGLVVSGVYDVLQAAASGRVETLLVRADEWVWGRYEPAASSGAEDLLGRAALLTLATRGKVVQLESPLMPSSHPIVATLRFAA